MKATTTTTVVVPETAYEKMIRLVSDKRKNSNGSKKNMKPEMYDRSARESFASFKEDKKGVQSFVSSKVSSYARPDASDDEEAVGDLDSEEDFGMEGVERSFHPPQTHFVPPMTNPNSNLHGFISPSENFHGWKGISVGGKKASRSYGDLRVFRDFSWTTSTSTNKKQKTMVGQSPFERLPIEVLNDIIDNLLSDIPPGGFKPRNSDLIALLLTSKTLHTATLSTLYKNITIPHSKVFRKFLTHVTRHPSLGTIVRRLDFSHFNPTGAGMSAAERASTMNLTKDTLLQCLNLLPNLREFLGQEHIDEDISSDVLRTLLTAPRIRSLDFCAASSTSFRDALNGVFNPTQIKNLPAQLPISRLSLHECAVVPANVFASLLPRLPNLTHLDVAHTRITFSALNSIPHTARLTHLNLSRCSHISGAEAVQFLTTHPAAKSLVYLNLMTDAKSHELLNDTDLYALIPHLPKTLRSLNLKGSKMRAEHMPLLAPLTQHLEELGLGRTLDYDSIAALLLPPSSDMLPGSATGADHAAVIEEASKWTPSALKYIDLSDLSARDVEMSLFFSRGGSLLRNSDLKLDVIELSESMVTAMNQRAGACRNFGWVVKGEGRRGWLVKEPVEGLNTVEGGRDLVYRGLSANKWVEKSSVESEKMKEKRDDGARDWKMGATYWGMRKVPVTVQEVGGMYGLYMFKR